MTLFIKDNFSSLSSSTENRQNERNYISENPQSFTEFKKLALERFQRENLTHTLLQTTALGIAGDIFAMAGGRSVVGRLFCDEIGSAFLTSHFRVGGFNTKNVSLEIFQGLTSRAMVQGVMLFGNALPLPLKMGLMISSMCMANLASEWMICELFNEGINPFSGKTGWGYALNLLDTSLVVGAGQVRNVQSTIIQKINPNGSFLISSLVPPLPGPASSSPVSPQSNSGKTPDSTGETTALGLTKMLAQVAVRDAGYSTAVLTAALRQLENPNPATRQRVAEGIVTYIKSQPRLKTTYAALLRDIARYWSLGSKQTLPPAARLSNQIQRTPLQNFEGKIWDDICKLLSFDPRAYQQSWLEGLLNAKSAGKDRALLGAPYQVGKTFSCIPLSIAQCVTSFPKKGVLIIAPQRVVKDTIVDDIKRMTNANLRVGIIDANTKDFDGSQYDVTVVSPWTLVNHLDKFNPEHYGVVATDEASTLMTPTGRSLLRHMGFLDENDQPTKNDNAFLFGFSADAGMKSFESIFGSQARIDEMGLPWFIKNGYLHKPVGIRIPYSTNNADLWEIREINGERLEMPKVDLGNIAQVFDVYQKTFDGNSQVIVNCATIEYAEAVAAYFNLKCGGEFAYADHSMKSAQENQNAETAFQAGKNPKVIVGVAGLAVGFRAKGAKGIINAYTTSSSNRYGQRLGRVLGIHDGEPQREVTIVDMYKQGKIPKWAVFLPQILGVEGYPADNVPHRIIEIIGRKPKPKYPPAFQIIARDDGITWDVQPVSAGANPIFYPTRFASCVSDAVYRVEGGLSEVAAALNMSEASVQVLMTGHLPKKYAQVVALASALYPDEPSRLLSAWMDDCLELTRSMYANETWSAGGSVDLLCHYLRRASLMGEYGEDGTRFYGQEFTLDKGETYLFGKMIRGEFLAERGGLEIPEWQNLVRKILTASGQMDEMMEDTIANAAIEISEKSRLISEKHQRVERQAEEPVQQVTLEHQEPIVMQDCPPHVVQALETYPHLAKRIDGLDLSVRTTNCLRNNAKIEFVWQLVTKTDAELLRITNFGKKPLNEVKEILTELGLELGMSLETVEHHEPTTIKDLPPHIVQALERCPTLAKPISELGLSTEINNLLNNGKIEYIWQLVTQSTNGIYNMEGCENVHLHQILSTLRRFGLNLEMHLETLKKPSLSEFLNESPQYAKQLSEIGLLPKTVNQLNSIGIEFVWQLVTKTEAELKWLGIKPKVRKEISDKLVSELSVMLGMILHIDHTTIEKTTKPQALKASVALEKYSNLAKHIDEMNLSPLSEEILKHLGITHVYQLAAMSPTEVLNRMLSSGQLDEIRRSLSSLDLILDMPINAEDISMELQKGIAEKIDEPSWL